MMNESDKQPPENSGKKAATLSTYALLFLVIILSFFILHLLSSILIPFALAIFLAYFLYPAVRFLNRLKVPYGIAVAVMVLLVVILFVGMAAIIVGEANSLTKALPQYEASLKVYIDKVYTIYTNFSDRFASLLPGEPGTETKPASVPSILTGLVSGLFSGLLSLLSLLSDFVIILFMLIFLLADAPLFKDKLIKAWGVEEEVKARRIVDAINRGIGDYIIIRTVINLGLAVVITGLLLILGIDYAYIWGPLTGLLNYIPYLGAFIAPIPPILVALATGQSYWTPLIYFICFVIIQQVEGNFLTPKLVGRRVNLNALAVLLSLILWGYIWGVVGMVLATPLTTCFKILCDNIEPLKPIGVLLGGAKKDNGLPS